MFKISTAIVAPLSAGLMGLACSNSDLRSNAHDGEVASGSQAGSTISNGTTGGTRGTIGPGGTVSGSIGATGGLSSPGGAGGTDISGTGGTIGSGGSNGGDGTDGSTGEMCGCLDAQGNHLPAFDCPCPVGPPACPAPTFPCEAGYQVNPDPCACPTCGYCGDGIIETNQNEECDLGKLNGLCLDANWCPANTGQGNAAEVGCPENTWVECPTNCHLDFGP